jgi:cell shape-determining protein MreC
MKKIYVLIFLILILIILNPDFILKLKYFLIKKPPQNIEETEKENLILKSQIAELEALKPFLPQVKSSNLKLGFVYFRYPFNFKNEILINLGEKDIKIGDAVVLPYFEKNNFILVGKVKKVFENYAVIQTLFDPDFKLSVKISTSSEALFTGGPSPKLTLIPRQNKVNYDDIVYAADSSLPYGLIIGKVGEIKNISNTLFNEATLILPYDLSSIGAVGVLSK